MNELLKEIANYYSSKLAEFGTTAKGADWNSEESQILRFDQLTKVIQGVETFSVNDVGCGYGALYDYLRERHQNFSYNGFDISADMIAAARKSHAGIQHACFQQASIPDKIADFGIASGIFNVKQQRSSTEWGAYIEVMFEQLNGTSLRGFAFNCLTSYSDACKMREYLYYADPCTLFDICKRRYSRHVALLHDYGLYEFTIIVRKE